jgi:hypothetical protein
MFECIRELDTSMFQHPRSGYIIVKTNAMFDPSACRMNYCGENGFTMDAILKINEF